MTTVGLVSRLIVVVVGCALDRSGDEEKQRSEDLTAVGNRGYSMRHTAALSKGGRRWIKPWYRFDAIWYAEVSQRGYVYEPGRQCSAAFFPLLPLLMASGAALGVDRYMVGFVAPNLAFAVGLACFGRVVLRATGDTATAWRACLLLVAYPFSFFFSAPYPESLAFLLTAAALLAWLDRRPAWSAVSLAMATAARVTAGAMGVGLLAEWADRVMRRRPARHAVWVVAPAAGLGIGAFFTYLFLKFGDPFTQLKTQAAWGRLSPRPQHVVRVLGDLGLVARKSTDFALMVLVVLAWLAQEPLGAAWRGLRTARYPAAPRAPGPPSRDTGPVRASARSRADLVLAVIWATGLVALGVAFRRPLLRHVSLSLILLGVMADHLAALLFLGLGIRAWWKRGPLWGCLILVPILQAMASGSSMSIARIALAAFPAFLDASELLDRRAAFAACLLACLAAQYLMIDRFVNWQFIG